MAYCIWREDDYGYHWLNHEGVGWTDDVLRAAHFEFEENAYDFAKRHALSSGWKIVPDTCVKPDDKPKHKVEVLRDTSKYTWAITLESGLFLFLDEEDRPNTEIEAASLFSSIENALKYKPKFGSVPGSVTLLEVKTTVSVRRVE